MKFKSYFNAYDTTGTQHTGFLQSMDFSALTTDITMINELTMSIIDAHLYNELSGSLVLRQWGEYMTYSKEHDRHEIRAQFYADFVNALAAKLYKKENWFKLLSKNFTSLSATDIKTIIHGTKETDRDYGEAETTREYGEDETATEYGATETATEYGATETATEYGATETATEYGATETATEYGATETATEYGAKTNTKQYDRVEVTVTRDMDTHVVGATQTDTDATTTNKLYPLGGAAYVDDTQSITDQTVTTNSQSNTDTWGDQETATAARTDTDSDALHTDTTTGALHTDTTTETLHTDTTTGALHTDTTTEALHTNTTTEALHTDTTTRAARTDTETKAARKDTETIKTYTDTEQHVKHILITPDKYYEIEKELADIGVYDLMLEAVKDTMLLSVWEEDCFVW